MKNINISLIFKNTKHKNRCDTVDWGGEQVPPLQTKQGG